MCSSCTAFFVQSARTLPSRYPLSTERPNPTDRHRGGGHPPTPATPPCVRVRTRRFETVTLHSSTKVGSPRDLKYALESPTVRALVRARCQGPRPLLAVLRASRGENPRFIIAARQRCGGFRCRQWADVRRKQNH